MFQAGYWYLIVIGLGVAVFLFRKKYRWPAWGVVAVTSVLVPLILATVGRTNGGLLAELQGSTSSSTGEVTTARNSIKDAQPIRLDRSPLAITEPVSDSVYSVSIPNCPTAIPFNIPNGFRHPSTPAERDLRTQILDSLHSNTARRARYREVLMQEWDDPYSSPSITFGTLGTVMEMQGKVSPAVWRSLRAELDKLKANRPEMQRLMNEGSRNLQRGSQADIQYRESGLLAVIDGDPNQFSMLQRTQATASGLPMDIYGGASFIYADKCLVYAVINVPAAIPEARELAVQLIEQTKPVTN